jgi:hypothetical protein
VLTNVVVVRKLKPSELIEQNHWSSEQATIGGTLRWGRRRYSGSRIKPEAVKRVWKTFSANRAKYHDRYVWLERSSSEARQASGRLGSASLGSTE